MPWCPKCKAEYQEGFTECTDCKVPLVEELDKLEEEEAFISFFQAEEQKTAEKLASFFEYSDLHCKTHYDEETKAYIVDIPPDMEKEARKLYEAFYVVEAELAAKKAYEKQTAQETEADAIKEDISSVEKAEEPEEGMSSEETVEEAEQSNSEDELEAAEAEAFIDNGPSDSISSYEGNRKGDESVYIMKSEQYKDLTGTVYIFLIFGIVGLVFVLLNVLDIIHLLNGWLPNTVMGVLFLLFIYIAISTGSKAKKIRSEIDVENLLTKNINLWLKEHVTESFLVSIKDASISDEANYIHYIDVIKEMLIKEFGPQNLAYLDQVIEDFYNSNFDNQPEE